MKRSPFSAARKASSAAFDLLEDTLDDDHDEAMFASGHLLSRRYHLLVAEDDGDMRALIAVDLRRDGYRVTEAVDGSDLLERLRELEQSANLPDLVVTDVRMPGASGLDALEFLQRIRASVPVVVITAFGDIATHSLAHELGATYTLDKPFALSDLRVTVYAALELVDSGQDFGAR